MKKTLNQNYKKTEQFYVNFWCPFPLVPELIINQNARTKCRITVNAEKSQKMKVGVNITEVNSSNYSTMISPHYKKKDLLSTGGTRVVHKLKYVWYVRKNQVI